MKELNILVCEGNTPEEGKIFQDVGIPTHTESLKESQELSSLLKSPLTKNEIKSNI